MSFIRWVFLLALVMLIAGIVVGQQVIGPMFAGRAVLGPSDVAAAITATAKPTTAARTTKVVRHHLPTRTPPTPLPTAIPSATPAAPTPTSVPTIITAPTVPPVATVVAVPHHVRPHRVVVRTRRKTLTSRRHVTRVAATAVPSATPAPTATPSSNVVALVRYWIGSPTATAGSVISVGYVIDNGTGHTVHVMLGASVKSSRTVGWMSSIADPYHDVVATVPPGVSTHIRYFSLPPRLRAGSYDVAWGLKNPLNGQRDALVFAAQALQVAR